MVVQNIYLLWFHLLLKKYIRHAHASRGGTSTPGVLSEFFGIGEYALYHYFFLGSEYFIWNGWLHGLLISRGKVNKCPKYIVLELFLKIFFEKMIQQFFIFFYKVMSTLS